MYCKFGSRDAGCEPALGTNSSWGRDFFKAIAYMTGGRYVPLANAAALPQVRRSSFPRNLVPRKIDDAKTLTVTR